MKGEVIFVASQFLKDCLRDYMVCYVCTFFFFSIIIPRGLSFALLCHIQYKGSFVL
jgi:hypothetical protein